MAAWTECKDCAAVEGADGGDVRGPLDALLEFPGLKDVHVEFAPVTARNDIEWKNWEARFGRPRSEIVGKAFRDFIGGHKRIFVNGPPLVKELARPEV